MFANNLPSSPVTAEPQKRFSTVASSRGRPQKGFSSVELSRGSCSTAIEMGVLQLNPVAPVVRHRHSHRRGVLQLNESGRGSKDPEFGSFLTLLRPLCMVCPP